MLNIHKPRERSGLFGACGGLLGWVLSELLWGAPTSFAGTMLVGALAGLGIGVSLGAAEGILSGSKQLILRGLKAGIIAGFFGGAVGALAGQAGFTVLSGRTSDGSATLSSPQQSVFSADVSQRLFAAGAKTGEIEISLIWENLNDLDLHVIDPAGDRIYFGHRISGTGGELDIDRNASCGSDVTSKPIEHVVWQKEFASKGVYSVGVHYYKNCEPAVKTSYRVEVKIGSEIVARQSGVVSGSGQSSDVVPVLEFTYPSPDGLVNHQSDSTQGNGWDFNAIFGRLFGWLVFGMLVGCAEGLKRRSKAGITNALLGGAIGGLIGGALFLLIASAGLPVAFSRLAGFVVLGASIGILIAIVDQLRSSFLVIDNGRFAGREIAVDKPTMRIGRSDSLEAYIGGDQTISLHHATLEQRPNGLVVTAVEGTLKVNGVELKQSSLTHGDKLSLGNTAFTVRSRDKAVNGPRGSGLPSSPSPTSPAVRLTIPPPPPRRSDPAATSIVPPRADGPDGSGGPRESGNPPSRSKLPPPPPRRQQ